MGASGWSYYVPYQADLSAALAELRTATFAAGGYFWPYEFYSHLEGKPRPATVDELYGDEEVAETGTHSILDVYSVVGPGEQPDFGTVEPVSQEEAMAAAGTERLTRAHVSAIDGLASRGWFGRCAVLHDDRGEPAEIYFWGYSGD